MKGVGWSPPCERDGELTSFSRAGFTIMELLASGVIGMLIIFSLLTLLSSSLRGYKTLVSSGIGTSDTLLTAELLRSDLDLRYVDLPLSIGQGKGDEAQEYGWDFSKGCIIPWSSSVGYGAVFPSEVDSSFPSDRIGFFISLAEDVAEDYGGYNIAHVLYFTALTRDYDELDGQLRSEDLSQTSSPSDLGYSRKLFRYFTPPDRVYQRLRKIREREESGRDPLRALPRGPLYNTIPVLPDDHSFTYPSSHVTPATLSVVAEGVAQFSVRVSGHLNTPDSSIPVTDVLSGYLGGVSLTEAEVDLSTTSLDGLLSGAEPPHESRFHPTRLQFQIRLIPSSVIPSLQAQHWDLALGEESQYLGREGLRPIEKAFSISLEK